MAAKTRRGAVESELDRLRPAIEAPESAEARPLFEAALRKGTARAVAKVAAVLRDRSIHGFEEALKAAFQRFMKDPAKTDPGCKAKLAALEALDYLETDDPEPFVQGVGYVQLEAAWGPPVDTATGVRSRAAFGIARTRDPDFGLRMAQLLTDKEAVVRQAAAEALAHRGDAAGAPLVHYKMRLGDEDPMVTLACMSTLMTLTPEWGIRTLRPMLADEDDDVCEMASLALSQARREDTLDLLLEAARSQVMPKRRQILLRAVAEHRSDRAVEELLRIVEGGSLERAREAVQALARRGSEAPLRERVRKAAKRRSEGDLDTTIRNAFGANGGASS